MFTERSQRLPNRIWMLPLALILLFLLGLTGCATTMRQPSGGTQSYIDDYEYLSAYGEWVDYATYGVVWLPDVVLGWEPFYYGHWIWTYDGWAWTSYEPYGWLVYHYGSWGYQPGFGWFWVPGDTWWPARVQWYTFGDYAAWAPFPPPNIAWPDPWDPYDVNVWIVVDIDNFTNENIGRHRIEKPISRDIVLNRTVVKRAPEVRHVERVSRKTVPTIRIREQETNIQPRADSKPPATVQRKEPVLRKMVLPKTEKRKVEKHTSEVKRDVLVPRKKASEPTERTRDKDNKDTDKERKRK